MAVHVFNLSTWEAERGGPLWVQRPVWFTQWVSRPARATVSKQNKENIILEARVTQWKKSASAASMRTGVNLKYHMESGERLCMPITPTLGDWDKESLKACWPVSLSTVSFKFRERPCLKKVRETERKTWHPPLASDLTCAHTDTRELMCTHATHKHQLSSQPHEIKPTLHVYWWH